MKRGSSPAAIMLGEPVERRVGIVAADALDERADRVVVAVAGAVVGEDALLSGALDVPERRLDAAGRVAMALGVGQGDGALEHVEGLACVAGREADEMVERRPRRSSTPPCRPERPGQAALVVGDRRGGRASRPARR